MLDPVTSRTFEAIQPSYQYNTPEIKSSEIRAEVTLQAQSEEMTALREENDGLESDRMESINQLYEGSEEIVDESKKLTIPGPASQVDQEKVELKGSSELISTKGNSINLFA